MTCDTDANMEPMEGDDGRKALLRELLSPTLNERLASLALRSEEVAELAEGLEHSKRFLDRYAADQSDLGATARLLNTKIEQLRQVSSQLSRQVMRHSHLLEDAAELAAICSAPSDGINEREGLS